MSFIHDDYDGDIRENLKSEIENIIESIAEVYESGAIDDPTANHTLMSLFALVCENKVEGAPQEDGHIKWSLTEEYSKVLEEELYAMSVSDKVVKGPW